MAFSHVTHHMGKVEGTDQYRLVRTTPIVKLTQLDETVYLQGGRAFSPDGTQIELPDWAYPMMSKLTPTCLKEAGFDAAPTKGDMPELEEPEVSKDKPNAWQCPECHKVIDAKGKEEHLRKHDRKHARTKE